MVPPDAQAALDELEEVLIKWRIANDAASMQMAMAIAACLDVGATWGDVGARLGITKQGARAHWSPYVQRVRSNESK
jgi:hypothetical protein